MSLTARVKPFLDHAAATIPLPPDSRFIVGVSGGVDSLALLHLLARQQIIDPSRLIVAHLNHGLRPQAYAEAAYVQSVASQWGLFYVVDYANIFGLAQNENWTVEEAARYARYRFFGLLAQEQNAAAILLAHHADDQAETVLLHLLRGTGPAGLRGMLPIAPFPLPHQDGPSLLRPLLTTPRTDLEQYCQQHQLTPIQDESNLDTQFQRNRIRHELLPLLESYNPQIRGRLRDLADIMGADEALLRQYQAEAYAQLVQPQTEAVSFARQPWRELPLSLRRRLLRQGIESLLDGGRELSFHVLEQARHLVETGTVGQQMSLPGQLRLSLGYETARIAAANTPSPLSFPQLSGPDALLLPVPGQISLADGWIIQSELVTEINLGRIEQNPNPWQAFVAIDEGEPLWLRPRRPGERIQPLGLNGQSQTIKKVMNERQIPAPARGRWPILAADHYPLWIVGHIMDHRGRVQPHSRTVVRVWGFESHPSI